MDLNEPAIFSVIVKIWLEEVATETGQTAWRGRVTHVPSNERRYVQSLEEITEFIARHLEDAGIKIEKRK